MKKLKVIRIRSVSKKQAEKEILGYLRKHGKSFTSQIADGLRLDVILVNDILCGLAEKGVVK